MKSAAEFADILAEGCAGESCDKILCRDCALSAQAEARRQALEEAAVLLEDEAERARQMVTVTARFHRGYTPAADEVIKELTKKAGEIRALAAKPPPDPEEG